MKKSIFAFGVVFLFFVIMVSVSFAADNPLPSEGVQVDGEYIVNFEVDVPWGTVARYYVNGEIQGEIGHRKIWTNNNSYATVNNAARIKLTFKAPGTYVVDLKILKGRKTIETWTMTYDFFPCSEIVNIVNTMSDSTLISGIRIIGKYKFVFANNQDLKADFQNLGLILASSEEVDIQNVGVYVEGKSELKSPTVNPYYGYANINLESLEITDPNEVVLVVFAEVNANNAIGALQTVLYNFSYFNGINYVMPKDGLLPVYGPTLSN